MPKLSVLFTSRYEIDSFTKPLVDHLRAFCDVTCSADLFWKSDKHFDIIHFQWPEELFGWQHVNDEDLLRLEDRMKFYVSNGARLAITRHNEMPHRDFENDIKLYALFEKYCHGQIHMGRYSLENLSYKNAENWFIEHPHNIHLDHGVDRNHARQKYNIGTEKTVYLLFGALRNPEEENMIIRNFRSRGNGVLLIAHSTILSRYRKAKRFAKLKVLIKIAILKSRGIVLKNKNYDNDEINELMALADVVVIARIKSLNSGVLYLAYSFKKSVIAPAIGNIREKLLHNPSYVAANNESIRAAFAKADTISKTDLGIENFNYVKSECDHEKIAAEYASFYTAIKNKRP
jgi:hypothetical protein